jgi:predicted dienelactone hydrolase
MLTSCGRYYRSKQKNCDYPRSYQLSVKGQASQTQNSQTQNSQTQNSQTQNSKSQIRNIIRGILCASTVASVSSAFIPSTLAAEKVIISAGPFKQEIPVSDLEQFSKTGKLSNSLQMYSAFFTPQVREVLSRRLEVDPKVADKFFDELVQTPAGKQLVASLGEAIPGSSIETLQATLSLALRGVRGLTPLSFLRAYPENSISIDASKAAEIALDFNSNRLQSQVTGILLARELGIKTNTSFKSTFDPSIQGKEKFQQQTFAFEDKKRSRKIPFELYWSSASNPQGSQNPLIVLSHGFGANRKFLDYLGRHLASHGLTVVSVEHSGSNIAAVNKASKTGNVSEILAAKEYLDRPKDVSFVLDELAKLNNQPGQFQGKFNTENVSIIGHSLGGYTALALVGAELNVGQLRQFCKASLSLSESPGDWLQCAAAPLQENKYQLQDSRIKSAIALNPLVGKLFGDNGINKINKPVLVLTSTEDVLTPSLKHQIKPFTQIRGNKYLLSAIGATHLSVGDQSNLGSAATTLVRERLGEETAALRKLTQGVTLAFVKQLTPEAETYKKFLTPAYAQSLSTSQVPLSLNTELPKNLLPWLDFAIK